METNELYPVFCVNELNILIVGCNVGLEKLTFLLKSSPSANVEIVSETFSRFGSTCQQHKSVKLTQRPMMFQI